MAIKAKLLDELLKDYEPRNGKGETHVKAEDGAVVISVPRDRNG